MLKKILCVFLVLFLLVPAAAFAEAQETADSPEEEFEPSDGASSGLPSGMAGLDSENFTMDDIPSGYLRACDQQGRVEEVRYPFDPENGDLENAATVYLPYGYDESGEKYNVLYLLHGSNGSPRKYLNPNKETNLKNLLDHMIADGVLQPLIVVAATYMPPEGTVQSLWLTQQVEVVAEYPKELVNNTIPAVEQQYRTFAESTDPEGITASRTHRGIAGFSLGGVAVWNVFQKEMRSFRWFLPISEASWSDEQGGTSGIWDSDVSAQVLYNAVLEQGYGKDDFRLFVATGTDDEAFEISTKQMISLLEYGDLFIPGDNTSCSMMAGGTHTMKAMYTYLYHILPALFRD